MSNIFNHIEVTNKKIERNINTGGLIGYDLMSQNVIADLRTLLDEIIFVLYMNNQKIDEDYDQREFGKKANKYAKTLRGDWSFISFFHTSMEYATSHFTPTEDGAEMLILKYKEWLFLLRKYTKKYLEIDLLSNLDKLFQSESKDLAIFYEEIAKKLKNYSANTGGRKLFSTYYLEKSKPFFYKEDVFYELSFVPVNASDSKFNRIIVFSQFCPMDNYSMKLGIWDADITVCEKKIKIKILVDWNIYFRDVELRKFEEMIGKKFERTTNYSQLNEVKAISHWIKTNQKNLLDIALMEKNEYINFKSIVNANANVSYITNFLDKIRPIVKNNRFGCNILRYCLFKPRFRWMESLLYLEERSNQFSGLKFAISACPFETMPLATSLKDHIPKIWDLLRCIDVEDKDHEFLARCIATNTRINNRIYTKLDELSRFTNIKQLVEHFNSLVYSSHHSSRDLVVEHDYIYAKGFESDCKKIVDFLLDKTEHCLSDYEKYSKGKTDQLSYLFDDSQKQTIIEKAFSNSAVCVVSGSAGTGKTTLMDRFRTVFSENRFMFLANTNPAIQNLRRRVTKKNDSRFYTIASFIFDKASDHTYRQNIIDFNPKFVVIDECSTICNRDMVQALEIISKWDCALILCGDTHQIEAIDFGNWFYLANHLLPDKCINTLLSPYRTTKKSLLEFWKLVRNKDKLFLEIMAREKFFHELDFKALELNDADVVLCLNYGGLYGVNNVNKMMQDNNPNPSFILNDLEYKVGDPVLFNESRRFNPILYNNLKGIIRNITKTDDSMFFTIFVDTPINPWASLPNDLEYLTNDYDETLVRFPVKIAKSDEDNENNKAVVVPFQVAYAISIHKAQGLEFNKVKIIITDEVDEQITNNIFYTAITRAREEVVVYWTDKTANKVADSITKITKNYDFEILKNKYSFKKNNNVD